MNEDADWGTTMNEALAAAHRRFVDLAVLAGTEGPKPDRAEVVYDEAVAEGLSQVEAGYRVIAMLHAEFPDHAVGEPNHA